MDLFTVAEVLSKEFISDKMEHSFEYTYWLFKNLISSIRLNMDLLVKTVINYHRNLHYIYKFNIFSVANLLMKKSKKKIKFYIITW